MKKVKVRPADLSDSDDDVSAFGFFKNVRKIENEAKKWMSVIEKEIVDNRYKDTSFIEFKKEPRRIPSSITKAKPQVTPVEKSPGYLILGTTVAKPNEQEIIVHNPTGPHAKTFKFNRPGKPVAAIKYPLIIQPVNAPLKDYPSKKFHISQKNEAINRVVNEVTKSNFRADSVPEQNSAKANPAIIADKVSPTLHTPNCQNVAGKARGWCKVS